MQGRCDSIQVRKVQENILSGNGFVKENRIYVNTYRNLCKDMKNFKIDIELPIIL